MLTIEETGNTVFRENFAERSKQRDTYMRFILFGILLASLPHLAWADLPLTVENLITDKGKIKLDLSLSYANADRQGVSTAAPISVQVSPTSFVTLPTQIGEHVDNSDIAVAALGLRYGLTAKAEVYARLSGLSSPRRTSGLRGSSTNNQSTFSNYFVPLQHQKNQIGFCRCLARDKKQIKKRQRRPRRARLCRNRPARKAPPPQRQLQIGHVGCHHLQGHRPRGVFPYRSLPLQPRPARRRENLPARQPALAQPRRGLCGERPGHAERRRAVAAPAGRPLWRAKPRPRPHRHRPADRRGLRLCQGQHPQHHVQSQRIGA